MKKYFFVLFIAFSAFGCKSSRVGSTRNVEVRFLHDYTIPADLEFENTAVGGLSGIDYYDGNFFLVSDHPGQPRFYKANIDISEEKITGLTISEVVKIDVSNEALKDEHLDLESIVFEPAKQAFTLSSEGSIKQGKDPMIFEISKEGEFLSSYTIPENFLAESSKKPRNNGTLEGLAASFDKKGIWAAMELPLKTDGPKPKLIRTKSPVRITYLDNNTRKAVDQFSYKLEPIAKIPWLYFAVNGVTDLIEYAPQKFLVVERGFASGHGSKGNTVRIFDVDASLATNTLEKDNLTVNFYNPAKKVLLYDFKWAKDFLSQEVIDNIEGICFGPTLPNGNRTLLLVSDNNFNSIGPQLNQVILMEFIPKN